MTSQLPTTLPKNKFCNLKHLSLAAFLMAPSSALLAQAAPGPDAAADKQKDWNVTLGLGVLVTPDYFGSKKMTVQPLPLIDIRWKNLVFINPFSGVGINLVNDEASGLNLSASVAPNLFRYNGTVAPRLRGLGEIKLAPQARLNASYNLLDSLSISASVGKDFGGTNGFQAVAGLDATFPVSEQFSLKAGVSTRYFDRKTAQGLFGVTRAQSANTGFAVYTPKSGLDSVTVSLMGTYAWSEHISIIALLSAEQRLGSSRRSPIIQRKTDPSAGIGLSYTF